MVENKN
jgi:L-asparaginase / beta-aspartyl-peptidase